MAGPAPPTSSTPEAQEGIKEVASAAAKFAECYDAWPHQVEALKHALVKNTVVNTPTGSGKTLVACMLLDAYKHMLCNGTFLSLFVVSAKALVSQQAAYLRTHTQQELAVTEIGFEGNAHALPNVVVGTAEALRGALERGQILLADVQVVVMDEVHYAVGKHPYAELLQLMRSSGASFRLLGLTASFLHGAAVDLHEKRDALQRSLFDAEIIAPEVTGKTEHKFFMVPWSGAGLSPTEIADYLEKTSQAFDRVLAQFRHAELKHAINAEKPRVRGVLEGLGPIGWYHFLREGLIPIVAAKVVNKMAQMEEQQAGWNGKEMAQETLAYLPMVGTQLAAAAWDLYPETPSTTGKCEALLDLMRGTCVATRGQAIVFVERVAVAFPLACIISESLGVSAAHICGVQGQIDHVRQDTVMKFRSGQTQVLVATASLEEGLDVPACRYVIRYDYFSSAKSHVQGAGRARAPNAEVYYFENDPVAEQSRRRCVEAAVRGPGDEKDSPPGAAGAGEAPAAQTEPQASGYAPGVGQGHRWGAESTMWDYGSNASFRGLACDCGARIHIVSKAFGRGRKKKERSYSVEGPTRCPKFEDPPDVRFANVDPVTGIAQTAEGA